jgi:hypothetical protein
MIHRPREYGRGYIVRVARQDSFCQRADLIGAYGATSDTGVI